MLTSNQSPVLMICNGVAELIEAADPKSLAKKIEELSHKQIMLDRLARLGSQFAIKHLDLEIGRQNI